MLAVRNGELPRVRELVEAGMSVHSPSPTLGLRPLDLAVIRDEPALVELLLSLGADPNRGDDRGLVPLALGQSIVHGGDTRLLDVLREAGARTNATNDDGFGLLPGRGCGGGCCARAAPSTTTAHVEDSPS